MDLSNGKSVEGTVTSSSVNELQMSGLSIFPAPKPSFARSTDRQHVVTCHMGVMSYLQKEVVGTGTRYRDCLMFGKMKPTAEEEEKFKITNMSPSDDVPICVRNVVDIKTLKKNAGNVFKGKFLFCRTIIPGYLLKGFVTVVEDTSQDCAVTLDLRNFMTCEYKPVFCEDVIPCGSFLAIKNPRLSDVTVTGKTELHAVLVMNSPGQVELLSYKTVVSMFPNITWKTDVIHDIPFTFFWSEFNTLGDEAIAATLTKLGNKAFKAERFPVAIRWYKLALEYESNSEAAANILANRAAAFHSLRCFHRALEDCEAALEKNGKHLMATLRKAKALIGLRKYQEAANFVSKTLEEAFKDFGRDKLKILVDMEETARKLASEIRRKPVDVDMTRLLKVQDSIQEVEDIIEYAGPLDLFSYPYIGRGLKASAEIHPGQLLICSKAFALAKSNVPHPNIPRVGELNNAFGLVGEADELCVRIAYRIAYQPKESGPEFYNLSAGRSLKFLKETEKQSQIVDMQRIRGVVQYNCFGTSMSNRAKKNDDYTAVWIFPSLLNHSCSDVNATWSDHGDILIIRAIKRIQKGQEIFISYVLPSSPLYYREMSFRTHAFECHCRLCQLDQQDKRNNCKVGLQRIQLLKQLNLVLCEDEKNWKEMLQIVNSLEFLRSSHPNLNACVATDDVHHVAKILYEFDELDKSLELLEKIFNVEREIGLVRGAIITALNILRLCMFKEDKKNILKWIINLKASAILAYGSIEPLKFVDARAQVEVLDDLKSSGYDIFN